MSSKLCDQLSEKYVLPVSAEVLQMQSRDHLTGRQIAWRVGLGLGVIALLWYSAIVSEIDLVELVEGGSTMGEYISRYFPAQLFRPIFLSVGHY